MSNDNNLITRKTLNEYLKRLNSKINKTNFRNAYIVGSTPLASDWLSDTDGGTPITPEKSKLYVIKTSGSYENFVYTYDGTSYVQPVAGANGGLVVCYANKNATTPYGSDFLIKTDGGTDVISPSQTITYLMFGGDTNYANALLRWNKDTSVYDIVLSSGGTSPIYSGATQEVNGTAGLVPPCTAGNESMVLRGDGSWGEPRVMVGATIHSDGSVGTVPKPSANDTSSALFGDGQWHKVYNSANGSTIHVVASNPSLWAGATVTLSDGVDTLTGTLDSNGAYTFTDVTLWGNLTAKATKAGSEPIYGHVTVTYFGHYVCEMTSEYDIINFSTQDPDLYGQTIQIARVDDDNVGHSVGSVAFNDKGVATYYIQAVGLYEFYIEFDVDKKIMRTYEATALDRRKVNIYFYPGNVYAYQVDEINSDPMTRVTPLETEYGTANMHYHNAHMNYLLDKFDYGSWKNAFFMPKPCQLKPNGEVDYYLDPDDYSKKADGTDDPNYQSTTTDDNVMIEFPTIYFKRWKDGNIRKCVISDVKLDDDFHAYAHHDKNGNVLDHIYMSAYDGGLVGTKLRSISGIAPIQSHTGQQELDAAMLNDVDDMTDNHEGWTTWHLADWMMVQDLVTLISMSTDSQTSFGRGNDSRGLDSVLKSGTLDKKGLFYGDQKGTTAVKVFGIENLWANLGKRIMGYVCGGNGTVLQKMTWGKEDGSTVEGFNSTGAGYVSNGALVSSSGSFIKSMNYNKNGMSPATVGGSATTYECDGYWGGNGTYAVVSGDSTDQLKSGAFECDCHRAFGFTQWNYSAALAFK